MSLLVTGSIGLDTVTTPHGRAEQVLGGSAVYFSLAASLLTPVRLVGVVGEDFPDRYREVLARSNVDLTGLEVRPGSRTFRWSGRYQGDMNEAETIEVDLNVLAERAPKVPADYADSRFVFLANTHPTLQRRLLEGVNRPDLVVCDTMNLWITTERESLLETLGLVDGVVLNDAEARQFSGKMNLVEAGAWILETGPRFVVIKKGEHGVLLVSAEQIVALPAYPTRVVRDPTGAGDSFAGGLLGYLAARGCADAEVLRLALVRGTILASFAIEDFSVRRLAGLTPEEFGGRLDRYVESLRLA